MSCPGTGHEVKGNIDGKAYCPICGRLITCFRYNEEEKPNIWTLDYHDKPLTEEDPNAT